jgi:hypothetical protein
MLTRYLGSVTVERWRDVTGVLMEQYLWSTENGFLLPLTADLDSPLKAISISLPSNWPKRDRHRT